MPDTERPGPGARLAVLWQYLLPLHLISRVVRIGTHSRWRPWKNWLIGWFVQHFGVDTSTAVEPEPTAYPSFNAFFTRALRPETRPKDSDPGSVLCPVDGRVYEGGHAHHGRLLQAKGLEYSLLELLGGDADEAARFTGGPCLTIYLSPRDYHRFHMPLAGQLARMVHLPGTLFSVAPRTTRVIPRVFARNERLLCLFDTPAGRMAFIPVGAVNVGGIETVWAGEVTPGGGRRTRGFDYPASGPDAVHLDRGAELGRFNMGSTVILLFEPGRIEWTLPMEPERPVRMGETIGRVLPG